MDETTKRIQEKLLSLMKIFHNVCVSNNLKYYMIGGTMLGAVRHKGFIPWDDDMDVAMPRKDYEKLLSIAPTVFPEHIFLKTPNNSKDVISVWSKLMDKNTTLIVDSLYEIIQGLFIDIFPLDGAGNTELSAKMHCYRCYWKKALLIYNQDPNSKDSIIKKIVMKYAKLRNLDKLRRDADKTFKKIGFDDSYFAGDIISTWHFRPIFMPRANYGEPRLYKFEDSEFYGVEKSHEFLSYFYGDYMKLPPVEHRKPPHQPKYLNLDLPYGDVKCTKTTQ